MNENTTLLTGYSGCRVELHTNGDAEFVRKISASEEYNSRLQAQIVKQKFFAHPTLKTPAILNEGYLDGLYYADMEYIPGKTVAALIRNQEYTLARMALRKVMELFPTPTMMEDVEPMKNSKEITQKLKELKKSLSKYSVDEPCRQVLTKLEDVQWRTYYHPECEVHGDLTLENILVYENDVYLVDFLDVFHKSMETDMAKLLQDLACGWSFRREGLPTDAIKFLKESEGRLYASHWMRTGNEPTTLESMLALTLLRIYPYLKDEATKEFLDRQLKTML